MTNLSAHEKPSRMGRTKLFPVRITLPLESDMIKRIDALLQSDEARLDFIREAIRRELKRRERKPPEK